jgi:hypothetical protein
VGIRRDLLKDVALASSAGPEFHQVVVPLHERNHPQQDHTLCPVNEGRRLQADGADENVRPFLAC